MCGFPMIFAKRLHCFCWLFLFVSGNAHSQSDRKRSVESNSGIIFLWESGKNKRGLNEQKARFKPEGSARYGNHFDLDPGHGRFVSKDGKLTDKIFTKGWTIEIVIRPSEVDGELINLPFAHLFERRDFLILRSKGPGGSSEIGFKIIRHNNPIHIVMSSTRSGIQVHQNGELTRIEVRVDKDPFESAPSGIVVGGNWFGRLYKLAVYSSINDGKVLYRSAKPLLDSIGQMIPGLKVRCRLKQKTRQPRINDLGPYARCLIYNLYDVQKVIEGDLKAEVIAVAHWAVLDRNHVTDVPAHLEKDFDLIIEPYFLHPQLKSERQFNDISNFDAPVFYDVSVPKIIGAR
jgi:hypothetical protein